MAATAEPLAADQSELDMLRSLGAELAMLPSRTVAAPRVALSPVSFECRTLQVIRTNPGHPGGGNLVLGQVPLSRFIRVPARHSYSDWLQRVGALSADLLLCDAGSRVLAVVDIRPATESERSRKRHERMAKVMRAANIHVHVWREGALPTASEVRTAMAHTMAPAAPGMKTTTSRP
jgi:hypothetical protein